MRTAALYALFCVAAIAVNIGTQDLALKIWPSLIPLSIVAGTATGLIIKYVLDKRFIFRFQTQNVGHDSKTFLIYSVMGLATTAIFWGFEYAFWVIFKTDHLRYLGGVIGLTVGYITKYHLDKTFVFTSR